jgi:hypothetical protein
MTFFLLWQDAREGLVEELDPLDHFGRFGKSDLCAESVGT